MLSKSASASRNTGAQNFLICSGSPVPPVAEASKCTFKNKTKCDWGSLKLRYRCNFKRRTQLASCLWAVFKPSRGWIPPMGFMFETFGSENAYRWLSSSSLFSVIVQGVSYSFINFISDLVGWGSYIELWCISLSSWGRKSQLHLDMEWEKERITSWKSLAGFAWMIHFLIYWALRYFEFPTGNKIDLDKERHVSVQEAEA